jgi:hypothetical protein
MGLFDTFRLPSPLPCPACGHPIETVQTKVLERTLNVYGVGDCAAHAEEIRVIRETAFCDACRHDTGIPLYFAIQRGILVGVERDLASAERRLADLNLEKLLLWYHDLWRELAAERHRRHGCEGFLRDLVEWYRAPPEERDRKLRWGLTATVLEESRDPLEAVEKYLAQLEET